MARRVRRHAHAHERPIGHIGEIGAHGENVVGDVAVFGHHHAERLGHLIAAHHRIVRAVDDAQNARSGALFGSTFLRTARRKRRNFHQIAVERSCHFRFGNEVFAFGRTHETERAAVHRQHAMRVCARSAARMLARAPHLFTHH